MPNKPMVEVDGVMLDDSELILLEPVVSESVIGSSSGRKNTPRKRTVVDFEASVMKVIRRYDSAVEASEIYKIAETLALSGINVPLMGVAGNETEQLLIEGLNLTEICEVAGSVFTGENRWMYEELTRRAEGYIRGEIRKVDKIMLNGIASCYDYSGKFLEAAEELKGFFEADAEKSYGLEAILDGLKKLEKGSSTRFKDATFNNYVSFMGYLVGLVSERHGRLDLNLMMNELAEDFTCRPELAARLGIDAGLVRRVVERRYRDPLSDLMIEINLSQGESFDEKHRRIESYVKDDDRADKDIKRMAYATIFARTAEGAYDFEDVMHMLFEGMFYVDLDGLTQRVYPGTDELHAHRFNQEKMGCLYGEEAGGLECLNQFYWNLRWAYKTLSTDIRRGEERLKELEVGADDSDQSYLERNKALWELHGSYRHFYDCIRRAGESARLLPGEMRDEAERLVKNFFSDEQAIGEKYLI